MRGLYCIAIADGARMRRRALDKAKKRGRSVNERPKSREETPKEGSEIGDQISDLAPSI